LTKRAPVDERHHGERREGGRTVRTVGAAARAAEQFPRTVTEKLLAYALGRRVEYYDQPAVRTIVRDAAAHDYRWSSLVLGIVRSAPFQMRGATGSEVPARSARGR
jgi:hypothetical protein